MALGPQQIWETSLGQFQLQVPRSSYDTWFRGTQGITLGEDSLTVAVATSFAAEWLERRMSPLIHKTVAEVAARPLRVSFQVVSGQERPIQTDGAKSDLARPPLLSEDEAPIIPLYGEALGNHVLNRRYTFANFVVGKDNQLAHAAAAAVADHPGQQYNPLFIYSGVGLGKTHLLHAIASHVTQRNLTPVYVTAERFTNEFILAIRERKTESFRAKYRSADVLLMDDIQFLAGKEQTQEGFFHTFNELHNANRQIVITCDRPPNSVALLADRLRSRFEGGLIADIQPPQLETRLAILHSKASSLGVDLSSDVAMNIARRAAHGIRELEGYLNRVVAMAHFLGRAVSPEVVDIALASVGQEPNAKAVTATEVIQHVATYYNVSSDQLCSRPQDRKTTQPQRVTMYILSSVLNHTPREIGVLLGKWHERTVRNTVKQMGAAVAQGSPVAAEVRQILAGFSIPLN
ncbi:MAG: chromosomal replication initiator protein DnaA [Chloroflexota bacterium]